MSTRQKFVDVELSEMCADHLGGSVEHDPFGEDRAIMPDPEPTYEWIPGESWDLDEGDRITNSNRK